MIIYYMWEILGEGRESVRNDLAKLAGSSAEETAIVRNATEALEIGTAISFHEMIGSERKEARLRYLKRTYYLFLI